ncbi:MAG: Serine/threonine protein kinase PrkC, regulator of stationary phase [Labilithrix sp.]|nr:Serine/threonine protein kinase PrkC, regulator of stationary phase [Labilithrix sp.]
MAGPADDKSTKAPASAPRGMTPKPARVRPPARSKALIGSLISDRYRIERLLGEGGMGAVYQAEHTLMRKRMAIKVLHPEMTRLPEVVARFEREAMAAAHIDHPHVVTATDFGKLEDGSFFLALEFVEGASLREVIAKGRLELGRSLHIARQMASALQRAHALKIVHRDLKPENVMLVERDGDVDFVKVLDFGIAKVQMGELGTNDVGREPRPEQNVLTQAGMVYGTPEYMAPEQALGQPVDARADLYALGVIMFEMLTGHRPFEAESKVALLGMQVTAPVPPMIAKCADCNVPPEVEALVVHLLAKEAAERIADAREVIEAISTILSQLAAAGRIDARYAPPPASGFATNPGFLLTPGPPDFGGPRPLSAPSLPAPPQATTGAGLLGGRAWLLAMAAGVLGLVVLVASVAYVFRSHRDGDGTADAAVVIEMPDGAVVVADAPLDEKVKEAIGLIDRGDNASGIKKLEDLGDLVASREDVQRALFNAYSATDRPRDAFRAARLLLEANPKIVVRDEKKIRVFVRDTALAEGTKDPVQKEGVEDAFKMLTLHMGPQGWDDLWDIAYGTSGQQYPSASKRAQALLRDGERARMAPSLQVTVDLMRPSCASKNHFERAAKDGDERTVWALQQLAAARPVDRRRKPCIDEKDITHAIAAIQERLKAPRKN